MSGGAFEYTECQINYLIIDTIEEILNRQGLPKPKHDLWEGEDKNYETYSEEVNKRMREGIKVLKKAYIYAHRIDYFLSGDDGEESFIQRLEEEINKLKEE
jgi:hypothetical protein